MIQVNYVKKFKTNPAMGRYRTGLNGVNLFSQCLDSKKWQNSTSRSDIDYYLQKEYIVKNQKCHSSKA